MINMESILKNKYSEGVTLRWSNCKIKNRCATYTFDVPKPSKKLAVYFEFGNTEELYVLQWWEGNNAFSIHKYILDKKTGKTYFNSSCFDGQERHIPKQHTKEDIKYQAELFKSMGIYRGEIANKDFAVVKEMMKTYKNRYTEYIYNNPIEPSYVYALRNIYD